MIRVSANFNILVLPFHHIANKRIPHQPSANLNGEPAGRVSPAPSRRRRRRCAHFGHEHIVNGQRTEAGGNPVGARRAAVRCFDRGYTRWRAARALARSSRPKHTCIWRPRHPSAQPDRALHWHH